ncbi:MAG: hypothetical protein IJ766_06850 [Clostridia bacterium]|nr:hypothetical protein [Clostridia bacterium]
MALKDVDNKANEKGKGMAAIWQLVKFTLVSMIAAIVQIILFNILQKVFLGMPSSVEGVASFFEQPYKFWFFESSIKDGAIAGLGYFIAQNVSNVVAQIVSFLVNRKKTFGSSANIAVTLPIYLVITVIILSFVAWVSPILTDWFSSFGWSAQLAGNATMLLTMMFQFFAFFPVQKILFKQKKEEAPAQAQ